MCGIAGLLELDGAPASAELVEQMIAAMAHRGPDGAGVWTAGPVGLGHRRLAVIDLSPLAAQPMRARGDELVLTYNGEVYNFRELRAELERAGHAFRSASDSEVLLRAWEAWGEGCLPRLNGMFAFALWDGARRRLVLARDRCGVKPLYWWHAPGRRLLFASEVKALLRHPDVRRGVCLPALHEYFTFQNTFSDQTLFEGVRLLPPGCLLELDLSRPDPAPVQRRWWDYPVDADPLELGDEEAEERFHQAFVRAVERQLVSDVPVGTYLSGGLDSASIAAVAARRLPRLCSFTAGFDLSSASGLELAFDERPHAELLANLFKTEHYEVVLHAGDMEWILPDLIWHLEDLRVGQSYPNHYVARLASKFVKVVLAGTGGDELLGGYPWRYYQGSPGASWEDWLRDYYRAWQRLVPEEDKPRLWSPATRRALAGHSTYDVFRGVFGGRRFDLHSAEDALRASLYFEWKTFLPGLLVVEDKLSMAHGLETRVPFLDDELVDLAVRLPARFKLRDPQALPHVDENTPGKRKVIERQTSEGKVLLRRAMARHLPGETLARPKQGFSAPDASWFRGESIEYLNRLLRDPRARIYDYLEPAYVGEVLDQHCSGRVNRRLLIWSFLCFEHWLRRFLGGS